jgi:hypothetical protein
MFSRYYKYKSKITDSLESNATSNQITQMINNYKLISEDEFLLCRNSLLELALKFNSKECAIFLIEKGAYCDPNRLIFDCKYDKSIEVFNLLTYFKETNSIGFTKEFDSSISSLISRLLEPSKVLANSKRLDYVLNNINFFGFENVKSTIEKNIKSNPDSIAKYKTLLREIKLKELGI